MRNHAIRSFILLGSIVLLLSCAKNNGVYNISDFGAKVNTKMLNTVAIQKAIDKCAASGGGTVLVPKGQFVTGTIWLKSNVNLHLEEGAELLGSLNLEDYSRDNRSAIEAPAFDECVVYAEDAKNIGISGPGMINGRGDKENFPEWVEADGERILGDRPMLMRLDNCKNISLHDVTFKDAASWCVHMVNCDSVTAQNVTINSHVNKNNDGFDLDGCKDALFENCNIYSGDDAFCPKSTTTRLCENIVIRNCKATSNTSAFKCGTSSRGGFKNIKVSNCDFSDTRMGCIKLLMVDGGTLEDIYISDIIMNNVEGPIFVRLGNRGRLYDAPTEQIYGQDVKAEGAPVGKVKNITIKNINATVVSDYPERCGIMISGIPDHPIENVVLENIDISYPGGGTKEYAKRVIAEDIARYPEQFFFGVLPSWGAFIRHAQNVQLKDVNLSVRKADARKKIYTEDVEGFKDI
jgi:polygalacturonase